MKLKILKLTAISLPIIILDQFTKYLVSTMLQIYHSYTVVPGLFNIIHIYNPGGAFGFLADNGVLVQKIFFIFFSIIATFFLLYFYFNAENRNEKVLSFGFALIFGGAIGNIIDRIRYGEVLDFLDVYIGKYHWPAFNVADSAISIGMVFFIYTLIFTKKKKIES